MVGVANRYAVENEQIGAQWLLCRLSASNDGGCE